MPMIQRPTSAGSVFIGADMGVRTSARYRPFVRQPFSRKLVWLGWTATRRRLFLRSLHVASLVYAIVIELVPWPPCPLTVAETWLEARAGIEPAHGPFLVRVLDALVYPNLPEWLVIGGAVFVCAGILCIYLRRYFRMPPNGQW